MDAPLGIQRFYQVTFLVFCIEFPLHSSTLIVLHTHNIPKNHADWNELGTYILCQNDRKSVKLRTLAKHSFSLFPRRDHRHRRYRIRNVQTQVNLGPSSRLVLLVSQRLGTDHFNTTHVGTLSSLFKCPEFSGLIGSVAFTQAETFGEGGTCFPRQMKHFSLV